MRRVDVAIVGAGTAGLSARSEVAKVTENYVVIDSGPLGTTCAREGCMPSKALIHAANMFHRRHAFPELGINAGKSWKLDSQRVLAHVRELRARFVGSVVSSMNGWRDDHFLQGSASFASDGSLRVNDEIVEAARVVVATGMSPVVPGSWAKLGDVVLTSDDLFELRSLPKSCAAVGLGVLGVELAQALSRLGVEVRAYEPGDSIGGLSDPELQRQARDKLQAEFPVQRSEVELASSERGVRVYSGDEAWDTDAALVAVGRRPNLQALQLENLGIEWGPRGTTNCDRRTMRVGESKVYLAGDVDSTLPVLHEASDSGRIAGYNAAREKDVIFRRRVRMQITFCDPTIAVVGQGFRALEDCGEDFVVGRASFDDQGRARIEQKQGGAVHVYLSRSSGRLLGAEMLAPGAEHFAHLLAAALQNDHGVRDLLNLPFYHPCFEEGLRSAIRDGAMKIEDQLESLELLRCMDAPVK